MSRAVKSRMEVRAWSFRYQNLFWVDGWVGRVLCCVVLFWVVLLDLSGLGVEYRV